MEDNDSMEGIDRTQAEDLSDHEMDRCDVEAETEEDRKPMCTDPVAHCDTTEQSSDPLTYIAKDIDTMIKMECVEGTGNEKCEGTSSKDQECENDCKNKNETESKEISKETDDVKEIETKVATESGELSLEPEESKCEENTDNQTQNQEVENEIKMEVEGEKGLVEAGNVTIEAKGVDQSEDKVREILPDNESECCCEKRPLQACISDNDLMYKRMKLTNEQSSDHCDGTKDSVVTARIARLFSSTETESDYETASDYDSDDNLFKKEQEIREKCSEDVMIKDESVLQVGDDTEVKVVPSDRTSEVILHDETEQQSGVDDVDGQTVSKSSNVDYLKLEEDITAFEQKEFETLQKGSVSPVKDSDKSSEQVSDIISRETSHAIINQNEDNTERRTSHQVSNNSAKTNPNANDANNDKGGSSYSYDVDILCYQIDTIPSKNIHTIVSEVAKQSEEVRQVNKEDTEVKDMPSKQDDQNNESAQPLENQTSPETSDDKTEADDNVEKSATANEEANESIICEQADDNSPTPAAAARSFHSNPFSSVSSTSSVTTEPSTPDDDDLPSPTPSIPASRIPTLSPFGGRFYRSTSAVGSSTKSFDRPSSPDVIFEDESPPSLNSPTTSSPFGGRNWSRKAIRGRRSVRYKSEGDMVKVWGYTTPQIPRKRLVRSANLEDRGETAGFMQAGENRLMFSEEEEKKENRRRVRQSANNGSNLDNKQNEISNLPVETREKLRHMTERFHAIENFSEQAPKVIEQAQHQSLSKRDEEEEKRSAVRKRVDIANVIDKRLQKPEEEAAAVSKIAGVPEDQEMQQRKITITAGSYVALTLLSRHAHPAGTKPADTPSGTPVPPLTPGATTDPSKAAGGDTAESNRISGPISVTSDMDQELRSQKITTIRLMYERLIQEYDDAKADSKKYPSETHLHKQLDEQAKLIKTLEQQLFSLTGVQIESAISNTGVVTSPSQRSPPSGLPPPGGTSSHRRTASNEGLEQIDEETRETHDPAALPPHPPIPPSQSASGPSKHRKHDSMPNPPLFEDAADTSPSGGASVRRTLSDSRKRGENDNTAAADNITMTSSLPASIYDEGTGDSPSPSPNASPSPASREAWLSDTEGGDVLSETPPDVPKHMKAVPASQVNVITMEDEDFSSNDEEQWDDHGPFEQFQKLKKHPAHLAVFLHYLICNNDPAPLLFYLSSEQYSQGGVKEMKKWAYEIYSTFLHEKAPLLVKSDERYNQSIQAVEHTLTTKLDNEVAMRALFQHARHIAHNDIDELLGEYRSRRSMGLANIYGEELHDGVMSKQEELSIVEKKLCPHFEKAFDDDSDRNRAIAYALATHLKSAGVSSSRGNGALDRCPTFNTKDRSFFKFGKKNTKKVSYFKGHSFAPSYFLSTTLCRHCDALIWGIGHQGVQCVNCDYVCHKHCMDKHNLDACQGTKKDKRKSIIEKIGGITRKPSTNNPTAIREAVGLRGSVTPNIPERLSVGESNKLSQVQRSKSLQAINQQASSSAAAKRTTFYVQHTPPRSPASPRSRHASNGGPSADTDMAADEEQVRNSQRVNQLVDRFSENAISSEVASSTPPRTHSPSPHETAENAEPSSSSFNDVANAEADALKALNHSESSSNSSLSRLESPSTSVAEGLNTHATSTAGAGGAGERASDSGLWSMSTSQSSMTSSMIQRQFDDSDFETDAELPPLSKSIPKDVIKKLKPKEKKRQEVINELFYTERAHMRNLKVMLRLFCQPMKEQVWIEPQFVKTLFPNMEEMIATHRTLNLAFKAKAADNPVVDEVADMLLDRFDGENGDRFKRAAATFCGNQTYALDMLRSKQRRDPKFAAYMQEQASHPLCRRLELKDFIPTVMQRLVKYPLLTESLLKYSVSNSSEHERLQRAQKCSKEILDYVNEAVSECENRQKLVEIQKRLDKKPIENSHNRQVQEYKAIDLTRKKMLHYGDLVWRIRGKNIELYVLLLEDILVLLQKQDDRLVLRCQTTNMQSALGDKEKFSHCPILKLSTLLVRDVATDRKAFFLISNNVDVGPQIYELVAPTLEERRKWYKYITQATQDQKGRDRLATHPPPTSSSSSNVPNRRSGSTVTPPRDTPSTQNTSTAPLSSSVPSSSSLPAEPDTPPPYPVHRDTTAESSDEDEDDEEHRLRKISNTGSDASGLHEGGEGRRRLSSGSSLDHVQHLEPQVAQQALIHPAEVVVTQQVLVQKADPVLTPYERLLQHDHHIEREMLEKKKLIAQMMQVSIKDFDHVAEMAREEKAEDSDAHSLLLASIHMSSELNKQIHNSLTQCVTTSCVDGAAAPDTAAAIQLPQVLTSGQLVENTQKLEQKLQHLMHLVQEREAETERLQAELDAARHKLQELSPRPHTQKGFFSADSNNSFSQLNNTSDEDLVDGVKRQRNEFSIAKASVLHQVRVEHCETIKVSSSPPALQPPPVVEARERAVSPIAVQHLTLATEEEQSEDSDTVTKDSEDSITKDSDEVVKDTNAVAKDSGDVSKDSVDSVATKSEDTAAGDKEEEDKSDNEKSEGKSEDSESESDSSDDDDDEEEGDEDEEEDDDEEEEDEVEVRCDDGASILQETLTVPDIAYLEAVDSDDEEKDEVRLEITEDDTKNSGENKEKEGGETSL